MRWGGARTDGKVKDLLLITCLGLFHLRPLDLLNLHLPVSSGSACVDRLAGVGTWIAPVRMLPHMYACMDNNVGQPWLHLLFFFFPSLQFLPPGLLHSGMSSFNGVISPLCRAFFLSRIL